MREQQVFSARLGQELHALPHGDVAPAHHPLLQCEIEGGALVGVEAHAVLRLALETGRPDLHAIVAGRQVFYAVLPVPVGQHADHDLGLGVAGLNEGAAKRRAVRSRHRSRDARRLRTRRGEREYTENSQKQLGCCAHGLSSRFHLQRGVCPRVRAAMPCAHRCGALTSRNSRKPSTAAAPSPLVANAPLICGARLPHDGPGPEGSRRGQGTGPLGRSSNGCRVSC